jgi:hypothetical protein
MSHENLSTLSELGVFNEALALMASNLNAHTNDPLDKAHGIALLQGYVDTAGNDRRTYQDSVGHIYSNTSTSGYNFVRFVINGQPYYAPAKTTAQEGKPATTGAIIDSNAASDEPQSTALVPEFATLEEQAAINTNSLLLEHTLKSAQNAHLSMSVVASPVTDNNGDTVGRYRVRLQIDDFIWEIPADSRLGGPWQAPHFTTQAQWPGGAAYYKKSIDKGDGWGAALIATVAAAGGLPITYRWQGFNTALNDWDDLITTAGNQTFTDATTGFGFVYSGASAATTALSIVDEAIPNDTTRTGYIRCRASNVEYSGGPTTSTFSNQLTLAIKDKTGCWICSAFWRARREAGLPAKVYETDKFPLFRKLVAAFMRYNPAMARFYLEDCGPLVEHMRAKGYNFLQLGGFNEALITLMKLGQVEAAIQLYLHTIIDLVHDYWPDCQHPVWLQYRHLRVPIQPESQ